MKDLNVSVENGVKELVIRQGDALVLKEPVNVSLTGVIDTPLRWLRKKQTDLKLSVLHFDRNAMNITYNSNPNSAYSDTIKGQINENPFINKFGINTGVYLTPFEMAERIKMNRTIFENQSVSMELVTALKSFRAKVDKEIEKADNNRGNKKILIDQVVTSNVPEKFNVCLPVFVGGKKETFEVEVYFRAEDLTCTLVSPAMNDIIESQRDAMIDEVVEQIEKEFPELVIIEC